MFEACTWPFRALCLFWLFKLASWSRQCWWESASERVSLTSSCPASEMNSGVSWSLTECQPVLGWWVSLSGDKRESNIIQCTQSHTVHVHSTSYITKFNLTIQSCTYMENAWDLLPFSYPPHNTQHTTHNTQHTHTHTHTHTFKTCQTTSLYTSCSIDINYPPRFSYVVNSKTTPNNSHIHLIIIKLLHPAG